MSWKEHIRLFILIILVAFFGGCKQARVYEQKINWEVTLDHNDKGAYGTHLSYEALSYLFPSVPVTALSRNLRFNDFSRLSVYGSSNKSLMVLVGLHLSLADKELEQILQFVQSGNEMMVFTSDMDTKLTEKLGYYKNFDGSEEYPKVSDSVYYYEHCISLYTDTTIKYGHKGRYLNGYFTPYNYYANKYENYNDIDTVPEVLGYAQGKPDILRFRIGLGHLTIHSAPLVMSNYFLLQKGNQKYLNELFSTLPEHINKIYWVDFLTHRKDQSAFGMLWDNQITRYGLMFAIAAMAVYILFEMKRRQRIIAIIPPLKNETVSFVETVGRLYYNKGNHANLANKIIQRYLEFVRLHYYINTNLLNQEYTELLIKKSGRPESEVKELINMVHEVRLDPAVVNEAYLYQLYRITQNFYKNHSA